MRCCLQGVCFFNDTATTEIYTLSLHDALPISERPRPASRHDQISHLLGDEQPGDSSQSDNRAAADRRSRRGLPRIGPQQDRKSTRLNSSHANISYAVFCLKKKAPIPPQS